MKYEILNAGYEKVFDSLEEAQAYMKQNGYVFAFSRTVFAGHDEDNQEVYDDAEYYFCAADLPNGWENMSDDELMIDLYGYDKAPTIYPRANA